MQQVAQYLQHLHINQSAYQSVLQIRDAYPGSEYYPSRIRIFSLADPGSASKNFSILTQKIVSKLSVKWSRNRIQAEKKLKIFNKYTHILLIKIYLSQGVHNARLSYKRSMVLREKIEKNFAAEKNVYFFDQKLQIYFSKTVHSTQLG